MDILKTAMFGITAVLLAVMFKTHKLEYATMLQFTSCLFLFFFVVKKLQEVMDYMEELSIGIPMDQRYVVSILKMIGISYVAEFAASICRDAGYLSVASQIQVFAKLSILILSMPVLLTFMQTLGGFL